MRIIHLPRIAGHLAGRRTLVRSRPDQSAGLHAYDVYIVALGDLGLFEVMAVCEDHETARQYARAYNEAFVSAYDGAEDYARVEEISFYPAGVIPRLVNR